MANNRYGHFRKIAKIIYRLNNREFVKIQEFTLAIILVISLKKRQFRHVNENFEISRNLAYR